MKVGAHLDTCMCPRRSRFLSSNSLLEGECLVYCFHSRTIKMWGLEI